MKRGALFATLLALTASHVQAEKPAPAGVYIVVDSNDANIAAGNDSDAYWTDPNVVGVYLRTTWATVQPNWDGGTPKYDWSYYDTALSLCAKHSKLAILEVDVGVSYPAWLTTDAGCSLWYLNAFANKGPVSIPTPWDPIFLSYWQAFVTKFGSRYDSNPIVTAIEMTGGGRLQSCYFAASALDVPVIEALDVNGVVGIQNWVNAMEAIGGYFVASFPNTLCYLGTGVNYEADNNVSMTQTANEIAQAGYTSWDCNALTGNLSGPYFFKTNIKIGGLLLPNYTCYQDEGPVGNPLMEGTNLTQTEAVAQSFGAAVWQPYKDDESQPDCAATFSAFDGFSINAQLMRLRMQPRSP